MMLYDCKTYYDKKKIIIKREEIEWNSIIF